MMVNTAILAFFFFFSAICLERALNNYNKRGAVQDTLIWLMLLFITAYIFIRIDGLGIAIGAEAEIKAGLTQLKSNLAEALQ